MTVMPILGPQVSAVYSTCLLGYPTVILAMTLLADRHSFAGSRYGICIDAKWFGDRLQLADCRPIRGARRSCLT